MCYDIELLVYHMVEQYNNGKYYNIDPETNKEVIFKNKVDIEKFLRHKLIKKPGCLKDSDYMNDRETYVKQVALLKNKILFSDSDERYFELFDKYPHILLGINRLATIFHSEQPYSFFDFDKLKFKKIKKKDDDSINKLVNDCLELLKNNYSSKFEGATDISTNELTDFVIDIFTLKEREFMQYKIEEYSIKLNNDDRLKLLINISYLWGVFLNFKESNINKKRFIEIMNKLPSNERCLLERLLNPIFTTDECIHLQGNRLKMLFVKWWFKYLKYYGFTSSEIAMKYIPITHDSNLYSSKKSFIQSYLLNKPNENKNGFLLIGGKKKNKVAPSWYYKMGKTQIWDGISLTLFQNERRLRNIKYYM
tara:strand:- start:42 stop:1136 length:1095 start_codon:yes stop_codon:yes gene_type:complete